MDWSTAEEAQRIVQKWRSGRPHLSVDFRESLAPLNEPHDDYVHVYEAWFCPPDLEQLQLRFTFPIGKFPETGIAPNGIGIGVERLERVAARLNKHYKGPLLATGQEGGVSVQQLIALLDAAADGRLWLLPHRLSTLAMNIKLFSFPSATALLLSPAAGTLPEFRLKWLKVVSPDDPLLSQKNVLRYLRW